MEFTTDAITKLIEHAEGVLGRIRAVNDIDPKTDPDAWIDAHVFLYNEMPPMSQLDKLVDDVAVEISKAYWGRDDGELNFALFSILESTTSDAPHRARYRRAQNEYGKDFEDLPPVLQEQGRNLRLVSELLVTEEVVEDYVEQLKDIKSEIEQVQATGEIINP